MDEAGKVFNQTTYTETINNLQKNSNNNKQKTNKKLQEKKEKRDKNNNKRLMFVKTLASGQN